MSISPGRFPPLQTTLARSVWVRMPCDSISYDTVTRTASGSGNDTFTMHNCLAVARFKCSGTTIICDVIADSGAGFGLGLYVNGVWQQTIDPVAADSHAYPVTVTLPAGIDKTIEIYEAVGCQIGTPVKGSWLQAVTGDVRAYPPQNVSRRLAIFGDSIMVGYAASVQAQLGLVPIIRSHYPGRVAVEAYSSRTMTDEADTTALGNLIGDLTFDATTKQILMAIGINDHGGSKTLATFKSKHAATMDAAHLRAPTATITCLSPIVNASEGANGNGDTLDDFRAAVASNCSTRTWSRYSNGKGCNVTRGDGTHPTDAGEVQLESFLRNELGY